MKNRYAVQQRLPWLGLTGQEKLRNASVLVVGAGGLGCPVLSALAGAGVGHIGIIDDDVVALENLHRQFLYRESDLGKSKALCAKERLFEYNAEVVVKVYNKRLDTSWSNEIVRQFDIIVDCTDNFAARYCICDACFFENKPWISGALYRTEGRVMLFNYPNSEAPNYRDLFPQEEERFLPLDCSSAGLLPSLSMSIGAIMANETIRTILGIPELAGKVFILDTDLYASLSVDIPCRSDNPLRRDQLSVSNFTNNDEICSSTQPNYLTMMKECSVQELHKWISENEDLHLIDVREAAEAGIVSIGGTLIPMSEVGHRFNEIPKDKKVIVYCRSGVRSANVIRFLQEQEGFENLMNLKGGILSWIDEIDPSLPSY